MDIRVRTIGPCVSMAALLLSSGCLGTYVSRTGSYDKGDPVGKWPYQAVVQDAVVIVEPIRNDDERRMEMARTFAIYGLLSIPVDVVCDTVGLPVDLVLWLWGFQKSPIDRHPYFFFVTPVRNKSGQDTPGTNGREHQRQQNQAAQATTPKVADPGR